MWSFELLFLSMRKPIPYMSISLLVLLVNWYFPLTGWIRSALNPEKQSVLISSQTVKAPDFTARTLSPRWVSGGGFTLYESTWMFTALNEPVRFRVSAIDRCDVFVDGRRIITTTLENQREMRVEWLTLKRGFHRIVLAYSDRSGDFGLQVNIHTRRHPLMSFLTVWFFPQLSMLYWAIAIFGIALFWLWVWLSVTHLKTLISTRTLPSTVENSLISIVLCFLLTVSLAYAMQSMLNFRQRAVDGCDSFGYLYSARLMSDHGFTHTSIVDKAIPKVMRQLQFQGDERELIFFQGPHAYYCTDFSTGTLINQYPPGFPLILRIIKNIFGEKQVFTISAVCGWAIALLLVALFIRRGAMVVGLCVANALLYLPLFFEHCTILMTDVLSALILVSSLLILAYCRYLTPAAIGSGLLLGFGLLIRYSNLLFAAPIAIILYMRAKERSRKICLILMGTALLSGVIPLLWYQYAVTGSPIHSTYPFTNTEKVQLSNIPEGLPFYLGALLDECGWGLLLLFVCGLLISGKTRELKQWAWACAVFSVVHLLFISANGVLLTRYLLPLLPGIVAMAGISIETLLRKSRAYPWWRQSLVVLLLLMFMSSIFIMSQHFHPAGSRFPEEVSLQVAQHTEPEARILADIYTGSLKLYGDRYAYRAMIVPRDVLLQGVHTLLKEHYPVYLLIDTPQLWRIKKLLDRHFTLHDVSWNDNVPFFLISPKGNSMPTGPQISSTTDSGAQQ